jgi:MoaA/NifB/PqqE/SkfB family radical SAM enzyme
MKPDKVSACGLLFCYNEEPVIAETIKYYLNQGIDLVIFDNQSIDSSLEIINCFYNDKERYSGRVLDLVHVPTEGYDWEAILHNANDYMHKNLNHYEWILIIDADTHFISPVRSLSLLGYLDTVKKYGYNIVHSRIYNFYPTEKDDYSITSYSERIKYFQTWNVYPQEKIFLYHPTVNFYARYAHWCFRDNRCVCINPGVIAKHYIWVSREHGLKKVFNDRKPRYIKNFPPQPQYAYMLALEKCLIKDSRELRYFEEKKESISKLRFLWLTRLVIIHSYIFTKLKKIFIVLTKLAENITSPGSKEPAGLPESTVSGPSSFNATSISGRSTVRQSIKIMGLLKKNAKIIIPAQYRGFIKLLRPYSISPTGDSYTFSNIIDRLIPPNLNSEDFFPQLSYPLEYHFLMTNYCNARCIFCNQIDNQPKNEITFDKFKTMVSHMFMDGVERFYFSGGGEPLLCRDFFDIIQYVNDNFPRIKIRVTTNGLLIEKYALHIAKLNLEQLIISVHGREGLNDSILQTENSKTIFKGLALLNKYQQELKKRTYKVFYVAVSQINISEVPALIKQAAELKVDEVSVQLCRYFSHRVGEKLKIEDSLFFHKDMYNDTIKKSAKLARKLGVYFSYSSLFLKRFKEQHCCAPWYLALVDWDGDVFPCTGGEARFYQKVKSGEYKFGNLLKEDVGVFWFGELYTKLRRHILKSYPEKYIPECEDCHNTICFKGPDLKESHIIPS